MAIRNLRTEFKTSPGGATTVVLYREVDQPEGDPIIQAYTFPLEVLQIRAGEYDIDPEDFDTLWDIVAHEPFLAPEDTDHLWEAEDIPTARARYLAAVQREKRRHEAIQPKGKAKGQATATTARAGSKAPPDPNQAVVQGLRDRLPVDLELVDLMRKRRNRERERYRAERRAFRAMSTEPSTDLLKAQLRRDLRRTDRRGRPS